MTRLARFGLLPASILLIATFARGGEPTLADAIRAAAEAVKPAIVTIEIQGQRDVPFIVPLPVPGEEGGQQFEFHFPPGVQLPRGFVIPKVEPGPGLPGLRGAVREANECSGLVVSVQGDRGLVAVPELRLDQAQKIAVKLADGRRLPAKVLGTDRFTGLACIEIRGPNVVSAKAGKATELRVGDFVAAVGGPATGWAVSLGIVSAKDRPGPGDLAGARLIETDALVTEAMAGGPLVNLKGEVVGMTFPSFSRPMHGRDLVAVLPIETVAATVATLARDGKIARGYLGVQFAPLPPDEPNVGHGVQVAMVMANSPAARAGIQAGDILLEFGGQTIADTDAFRAQVAATRPGTRVPVRILRGGQPTTVEVTVGEPPAEVALGVTPGPALPEGGEKLPIGLTVQPLTPALANLYGLQGHDKGLLVTRVDPAGPAAKARPNAVEPGDLIEEIARKPVASVAEAQGILKELRDAKAKSALLLIRNKTTTRYIVVDLPE